MMFLRQLSGWRCFGTLATWLVHGHMLYVIKNLFFFTFYQVLICLFVLIIIRFLNFISDSSPPDLLPASYIIESSCSVHLRLRGELDFSLYHHHTHISFLENNSWLSKKWTITTLSCYQNIIKQINLIFLNLFFFVVLSKHFQFPLNCLAAGEFVVTC